MSHKKLKGLFIILGHPFCLDKTAKSLKVVGSELKLLLYSYKKRAIDMVSRRNYLPDCVRKVD